MKIMPLALDETTSISISDPNISAVSQDIIAIEDIDRKARVAKLLSPSKRYSLSIQGLYPIAGSISSLSTLAGAEMKSDDGSHPTTIPPNPNPSGCMPFCRLRYLHMVWP